MCAWQVIWNIIDSDIHFAEEKNEVRRAILSCSLTAEKMGFKGEESEEEQGDTWRWWKMLSPPAMFQHSNKIC